MVPAVRHIDVCNGDADGLCSVVQWRLHEPVAARLVTGLKRDIELFDRVQAAPGDQVLVCDLSMQRNRQAFQELVVVTCVMGWRKRCAARFSTCSKSSTKV